MEREKIFCPNYECEATGQQNQGNIGVHHEKSKRFICHKCGKTFSTTKGTIFYRLRTDAVTVMLVITLIAYGCPIPAIVKAFGFDERTVKRWWEKAGKHCEAVHEHVVQEAELDVGHAQADEIKVKMQGKSVWMAMGMTVKSRLWLGGVISERRDKNLITQIAEKIRNVCLCRPLLLEVDGLASYVTAFRKVFRSPVPRHGEPGRRKLRPWDNINITQVVKQSKSSREDDSSYVEQRIVQGSPEQIDKLRQKSGGGKTINTAYIERLNATFRQRLANLGRRTRYPARQVQTLISGMFIVGCLYNFCDSHKSLRQKLWLTENSYRWVPRTPALAAGLTDHIWTPHELFHFKVPPPPWIPPDQTETKNQT